MSFLCVYCRLWCVSLLDTDTALRWLMTESCTPGGKATSVDSVHPSPLTDQHHTHTHTHTQAWGSILRCSVVSEIQFTIDFWELFLWFEWLLCIVHTAQSLLFLILREIIFQAVDGTPDPSDWVRLLCQKFCLCVSVSFSSVCLSCRSQRQSQS